MLFQHPSRLNPDPVMVVRYTTHTRRMYNKPKIPGRTNSLSRQSKTDEAKDSKHYGWTCEMLGKGAGAHRAILSNGGTVRMSVTHTNGPHALPRSTT